MTQPFSIQPAAMGLVLWNPTEEDFHMQYSGVSLTMKAGDKEQFEMNCARHLLNGFGARGLTSLTYGCDESKVSTDARERNREFNIRQVENFNKDNESRKITGRGQVTPSSDIKKYALKYGLQLFEPYRVQDEERSDISSTKRENEALKTQMAEMQEMLRTLMEAKKKEKVEHTCDICGTSFEYLSSLGHHKKTCKPKEAA